MTELERYRAAWVDINRYIEPRDFDLIDRVRRKYGLPDPVWTRMSQEQLLELADKWEQSEPPPSRGQYPGDYETSLVAHKMARFLREMAAK